MLPIDEDNTELRVYWTDGADSDIDETNEPIFGTVDPDVTIPAADVASLSFNERLAQRKDGGDIEFYNDGGQYTAAITSGDRIEVHVDFAIPQLASWGDSAWGDKTWGGQRIVWTCWVRDRDLARESASDQRLIASCEDFVFGIMSKRFTDLDVTGTQFGGALSRLLVTDAPETRLSVDYSLTNRIDATFAGSNLLDAVNQTLTQADVLAWAHGDMMVAKPIGDQQPKFTVQPSDIGLFEVGETDDQLVNFVRVDGGTAMSLDYTWPFGGFDEHTGWEVIDSETTKRYWMPVRKSEVAALKFYTERISEDSLTVRINYVPEAQRDPNEPTPEQNRQSDLARRQLTHDSISKSGWTEFQMPDHQLHTDRPFVIIESDGEEGQRIAVADDGQGGAVPIYQLYFPYNIVRPDLDPSSIDEYHRREERVVDDQIDSFDEAHAVARQHINHYSSPDQVVHTRADSLRTHMLRPGDVVKLDFPDEHAVGEYVVIERSSNYDGVQLDTDLALQDLSSI